jgi:sugar phosphate isomerase/epimerase
MREGRMKITDAARWIADHGGEHIEIVPIDFSLIEQPQLIDEIRKSAEDAGIEISNYAVGNNFIVNSEEELQQRINELKAHVDVAHKLGVKRMRHDVASRPIPETTIQQFEADLPTLVRACQEVADYAKQYGITTSVENHGFYIQAADRVQRLVAEVNRDNFKTTLDVGNFMCVDENPVVSVKKNLPIASMIHVKDFYLRHPNRDFGEGWFRTAGGYLLRGAIAGQGDLDLPEILRTIKSSGYDGYISLEFEGMEPCEMGTRLGLEQVRKLWNEV